MSSNGHAGNFAGDDRRIQLARRADVELSRLVRIVDALNRRRHHVAVVGHRTARILVVAAASLAGIAIVAAAIVASRRHVRFRRIRRRPGYRLLGLLPRADG